MLLCVRRHGGCGGGGGEDHGSAAAAQHAPILFVSEDAIGGRQIVFDCTSKSQSNTSEALCLCSAAMAELRGESAIPEDQHIRLCTTGETESPRVVDSLKINSF